MQFANQSLLPTNNKLYAYGTESESKQIPIKGKINLNVKSLTTNKSALIEFIFSKGML